MKKKKLLAAAIVLCMVIQLLCACGKQKISMSDKVYVGVTYRKCDEPVNENNKKRGDER